MLLGLRRGQVATVVPAPRVVDADEDRDDTWVESRQSCCQRPRRSLARLPLMPRLMKRTRFSG